MPLRPFAELMDHAEAGQYAVGYFESWNLESLLAVADAAEQTRSPVILGFSGINLPDEERVVAERLSHYAALGQAVGEGMTVPTCLLFNECPCMPWVTEAIELGFGLVMFADDDLDYGEQKVCVREVVEQAHARSLAVEAEVGAIPGATGPMAAASDQPHLTDPAQAAEMVAETGVDALAVNVGQLHLHGRSTVRLDMERLRALRDAAGVPLVLHGATSVARDDLAEAGRHGVRKINVGSILKQTYFETLREACLQVGEEYNPYRVIGSGLPEDVLTSARVAMQKVVAEMMELFGSAGRARVC